MEQLNIRYPWLRKELLALLEEDQREVRECSKAYRRSPRAASTLDTRDRLILRAEMRAKRVLEILDEIGAPTVGNIGSNASQAVSVLALHSRLSIMKEVLASYEASFRRNPGSIYYEAIPSLTDRILILERKKQRFGTQWILGADEKFFLPPVEDFEHMNERRAAHGLGKSKNPIDLTNGVPKHELPRPETQASDQRVPTEQEYQEFVYGSLD